MQYKISQVARVALRQNWSRSDVITAVAIAWAESHGRTDARGDIGLETAVWGPSVGLWQIRSLKSQYGTGGLRDEAANLNPWVNGRHAYSIWSQTRSFRAWSTYLDKNYLKFHSIADAAVAWAIIHPPQAVIEPRQYRRNTVYPVIILSDDDNSPWLPDANKHCLRLLGGPGKDAEQFLHILGAVTMPRERAIELGFTFA